MFATPRPTPGGGLGAGTPFDLSDHPLCEILRKEPHFDPKSAAVLALGKLRALGSRGDLEGLLASPGEHAIVRESSALALGLMQSLDSLPALLAVAADAKAKTSLRVHALIGLGLMREASAVGALPELLAGDQPLDVRVAATMALGEIGGPEAAEALVGVIRDGTAPAPLRAAAVTGVGKLGIAKAGKWETAELLRRLVLADRENHVRRAAALVLHRIRSADVVSTLVRVARNERDSTTCGFAMLSLAESACRDEATPADRSEARTVLEAVWAPGADATEQAKGFAAVALGLLGRCEPACAEPLRRSLRDAADWRTRAACAVGLGIMADAASVPDLLAVVRAKAHADLQGYAALALGWSATDNPEVPPFLLEILRSSRNPELKVVAAIGLGRAGPCPEALEALRGGLAAEKLYERLVSAVSIGYLQDPAAVGVLLQRYQLESSAEARALLVTAIGWIGEAGGPRLKSLALDFNYLAVDPDLPTIDRILRLF